MKGMTFDEWVIAWGAELPNGLKVVWVELKSKTISTGIDLNPLDGTVWPKTYERKEWCLIHNSETGDPTDGINEQGYLAFDDDWVGNDDDAPVIYSSYQTNTVLSAEVEDTIDIENTNFRSILSQPDGVILKYSDAAGGDRRTVSYTHLPLPTIYSV